MRQTMKTIQMTLEEHLLNQIDSQIKQLKTTRSAFIRNSVRYYLRRLKVKELEAKHRKGYLQHPIPEDEFSPWENEQNWG
jgi:metal-responsive CopG/Arc/MetJ family transcriptional regulator